MNLNKLINIGLVIIPAALSGGVLVVASVATISIVNNTIPQPWLPPYNDIVTNLSESEDLVDKDVLDFYQKSTVSLSFTPDGNTWISGTAWYWGKKSIYTYFATNIHVINSLLTYNASETSKPYEERFSFRGVPLHYQFYNVNTQYNKNPEFADVKLVKIAVIDNNNNTISSLPDKLLYSDLAIFSTTTNWSFDPLKPNPVLDFIDTEQELKYLTDNVQNLTYYISGFPHHNHKAVWTTGKYKWKRDNNLNGYKDPPNISIARANLGTEGGEHNTGLDVVGHKYYSYSRQLLLPALNFAGGSSGSLVSIVKEVNGKSIIQPVGIYWGVYSSIDRQNNTIYRGGIDLFYSNDYSVLFGSTKPKFRYNNVSWWNNLPNLII